MWHDVDEMLPDKSGHYLVEDRWGRQFRTWYEATIQGFNMIHDGKGSKIVRWQYVQDNRQKGIQLLHEGN